MGCSRIVPSTDDLVEMSVVRGVKGVCGQFRHSGIDRNMVIK